MDRYTLFARRGRLVRTPPPLRPLPRIRVAALAAVALAAAALALMGGAP